MQQIQNNTDPVVRIERPRPILSHLHSLVAAGANSPGNSSASQTLSDLAAAASDQLMAENAAAAAAVAADASVAADAAEAAAEAASVLDPRRRRMDEDPLLSDHPYGAQTARRPPPTTPNSTAQAQQDPLLSDHPYGSPTGGRPPPTGEYRYRSSIISQWLERQESK